MFKKVGSSKSHKKIMVLLDSMIPRENFSFFLSSTFVYEQILIKISMIANIEKTQFFHEIKCDLLLSDFLSL